MSLNHFVKNSPTQDHCPYCLQGEAEIWPPRPIIITCLWNLTHPVMETALHCSNQSLETTNCKHYNLLQLSYNSHPVSENLIFSIVVAAQTDTNCSRASSESDSPITVRLTQHKPSEIPNVSNLLMFTWHNHQIFLSLMWLTKQSSALKAQALKSTLKSPVCSRMLRVLERS